MALKSAAESEREHMARRENKDEEWRKEADERRRCETGGGRGVINRKWKKRKVTAGMGDVTGGGMRVEMAGSERTREGKR